jgi:hypothetical protein
MPLLSCALVRLSTLREVGALDEALRASEDRDLWLRLAQRTDFAGTPDVLVVRYLHRGAHLSRNYPFIARDAVILAAKWKTAVAASCGWRASQRWRAILVGTAELVRAMQAADENKLLDGLESVGRMARHLPWSMPFMVRALVLTILGSHAYVRLARSRSAMRAGVARLGTLARIRARHRKERRA